jgi:anti-anti-sigma factor
MLHIRRKDSMPHPAPSERSSGASAAGVGKLDGLGLSYELQEEPDGVVLALRGELDLASAPELQRQLLALVARPVDALTLDLAGLDFLDSSGLGALYRTRQAADEVGIPLRLRAVPDHVLRVLDVTAMAPLFGLDAGSG